jgi:release factor glutamine methyltransferase
VATTLAGALRDSGLDAIDARALLRHAIGCDEAWLISHPDRQLSTKEQAAYANLRARRAAGEPVAYLTGEREFYSLAFKVTPAVLIPRPDTELLVEAALEHLPVDSPLRVLDLATGSGCVAVTIARQRPRATVTATDISRDALTVARGNAARHGAIIEFVESDWFAALTGRCFDLIVANPPYIAAGDAHLAAGDLRFEPRAALLAGPLGLECIEVIVEQAPQHLAPGGWLLFEHGYDQGPCSRALLAAAGYDDIVTRRDLAGSERVSGGRV